MSLSSHDEPVALHTQICQLPIVVMWFNQLMKFLASDINEKAFVKILKRYNFNYGQATCRWQFKIEEHFTTLEAINKVRLCDTYKTVNISINVWSRSTNTIDEKHLIKPESWLTISAPVSEWFRCTNLIFCDPFGMNQSNFQLSISSIMRLNSFLWSTIP